MKIQCPECDQRFDVAQDFLGKTVECGACDHRFKVSSKEVVAGKKKFYPGEREASKLKSFAGNVQKGPASIAFETANYQQETNIAQIGPLRPRKVLAIFAGISIMAVVILIFVFAGGREGPMRDVETLSRFILCGFAALLGGVLVLYGMSHNKGLSTLLTLIFAALLLLMPVFFPGNEVITPVEPIVLDEKRAEDAGEEPDESEGEAFSSYDLPAADQYLLEIGYRPVENALLKHPKESVVAIFVRNTSDPIRDQIARYLYNVTGEVSRETVYKRGANTLMLLVDHVKSIDEIAAMCGRFGRVEKVDKDLRLIDVVLERSKVISLNKQKVLDSESLDYESQNLRALQSFDPSEQMIAVKRLAVAKPRALRAEITKQLIKMLPLSDADLQLEIIRALKTWALPESGAGPVVLDAVEKLHLKGKVSKPAMEFLITHQVEGCENILLELWQSDPGGWSETLIHLGAGAEILLLPRIKEMDMAHAMSASDILGKVGTAEGLKFLQGLLPEMEGQKKKSLQAAIDEIKKRS